MSCHNSVSVVVGQVMVYCNFSLSFMSAVSGR